MGFVCSHQQHFQSFLIFLLLHTETVGTVEGAGETAVSFSPFDMASWVEELSLTYYVDWKEKLVALKGLTHLPCSAAGVCEVWEKVPGIDRGQLPRRLHYRTSTFH